MCQLSIVLVEPQGDANIGAVARVMKNCGAARLMLVNPAPFDTPRGRAMACSAQDVLKGAQVVAALDEAIAGSSLAVGFTARTGRNRQPTDGFAEGMAAIANRLEQGDVALVFGREDDGLTNEELDRCESLVSIPSHPSYPSFNLAQAVAIALHAIWCAAISGEERPASERFVSRAAYQPLIEAFGALLGQLGYTNDDDRALAASIVQRMSAIIGRAGLEKADLGMFEGLMARLRERCVSDRRS